MDMSQTVTYEPCATSLRKQTVNIITFTQFEDGNLLSKTRNNAESGDKSDDNSIMPPLIREEETYVMDSGDKYEYEPMHMEMLEKILDIY